MEGRNRFIVMMVFFFLLTILFTQFQDTYYYSKFLDWSQQHLWALYSFLFILRVLSIVWPPLAATVLLYSLIPVLGWFPVFLIDYIGEIVGSVIAYYLAYYHADYILEKLLDEKTVAKIKRIKIVPGKEFEMLMVLRVVGGAVFDIVCYAAGIFKMPFKAFFWSSAISYLFISLLSIKLVKGLFNPDSFWVNLSFIILLLTTTWVLRDRYIQYND